jgi:hypothetical protein
VSCELHAELLLRQRPVVVSGLLRLRLSDGPCRKAKFDFLPPLVVGNIPCRNSLHPENLDFITVTSLNSVLNARKIFWLKFMHLLDVNSQTASGVQTTRTHATLEVLGLLVLHQNFLILKLALTVPAPRPNDRLILLFSHVAPVVNVE